MEEDWEPNERGVSYCFGKKVIMNFLQRHDFDLVCRAHMVVEDGYEFYQDRILVTVFSAPNVSTEHSFCMIFFCEEYSYLLTGSCSTVASSIIGVPLCQCQGSCYVALSYSNRWIPLL